MSQGPVDLRVVLAALGAVAEATSVDELSAAASTAVVAVVGADSAVVTSVSPSGPAVHTWPDDFLSFDQLLTFERVSRDHRGPWPPTPGPVEVRHSDCRTTSVNWTFGGSTSTASSSASWTSTSSWPSRSPPNRLVPCVWPSTAKGGTSPPTNSTGSRRSVDRWPQRPVGSSTTNAVPVGRAPTDPLWYLGSASPPGSVRCSPWWPAD